MEQRLESLGSGDNRISRKRITYPARQTNNQHQYFKAKKDGNIHESAVLKPWEKTNMNTCRVSELKEIINL